MTKKSEETKRKILEMGVLMWNEKRSSVTAHGIAHRLGLTHGTIHYQFPNGVLNAVARYGFEIDDDKIVCDLIIDGHPLTKDMSLQEKQKRVLKVL